MREVVAVHSHKLIQLQGRCLLLGNVGLLVVCMYVQLSFKLDSCIFACYELHLFLYTVT